MDDKLDQLLIASSKLDSILKALHQPTEPVPMQQVEKPLAYQTQSGPAAGRLFGGRSTEPPDNRLFQQQQRAGHLSPDLSLKPSASE